MAISIPETTINSSNGRRPIPLIGMGLGRSTTDITSENVKTAIIEAIKVGYRHFDTAAVYGTEQPLGEAIEEALRLGLIKSQTELFVTTKLWCTATEGHLVLPAIKQSLKNLRLEYVDLYLIHWPVTLKCKESKFPIPNEWVSTINIKQVWEAMENCQNLGLTKSIGVSNFHPQKLEQILSFAKIPPAVNQVEMNPVWQQKKLNEFCKKHDILLTGYSPLGAGGNSWGHNRVIESDVLQDIAKFRGKSVAQISLRWLYEQGVGFVVKSFNQERMKQNLEIFDWSLSEEELNKISQIPQQKHIYFGNIWWLSLIMI
ncbi:D-galacturonate reductase-like [Rutidosis leptorrhynchoides]|uniref:D-galacturonate reductase-like n=1 Tax=Rutidosis leptorrhynchoides TaxID=125765 RepID=UPI003A99B96A